MDTLNRPRRALPPFRPARWLRGGHRQTIAGAYLNRGPSRLEGARTEILVPGGDRVVIHDAASNDWRDGQRIVLLVHGLGGSYRSPYVMRVAAKLRERGLRTVQLNLRGCGDAAHLAASPGHAGRSEDAAAVAHELWNRYPNSPLTLVGFSMGGNIVLKLAGELNDQHPPNNVDSCWAAGPPIDISRCAANMNSANGKLYTNSFLRLLWKQLHRCRRHHQTLQQMPFGRRPRRIDEFDSRFTAPLSGFRDVEDYYTQSSAAPLLRHIEIPTQIIAAEDDPIVPHDVFADLDLGPQTEVHLIESGGHLGFVAESGVDPDRRWLDWRVVDWVLNQGLNRREAEPPGRQQ